MAEGVALGEETYFGDDETVDEESEEEVEEVEEVGVKDLIQEWQDFCKFGKKTAWGSWLDHWAKPSYIDEVPWNRWYRRWADKVNGREAGKTDNMGE